MPSAGEVVGSIPDFTSDSTPVEPKEPIVTEAADSAANPSEDGHTGKETQTEPPADTTPAQGSEVPESVDTSTIKEEKQREINSLEEAKRELILELDDLRGQKREAKKAEIAEVQQEIQDKLEDINPDDVSLIDRVLKAKGYVARGDVSKMFYDARKNEVFSKFLKEFPEYSEVNDPDRRKFGPLLRELQLYKEPSDPDVYGDLLRRAHSGLSGSRAASGRSPAVQKRQAEIAGVGSGGAQRSSSVQSFSVEKRMILQQGGWSDEDIANMEKRASSE